MSDPLKEEHIQSVAALLAKSSGRKNDGTIPPELMPYLNRLCEGNIGKNTSRLAKLYTKSGIAGLIMLPVARKEGLEETVLALADSESSADDIERLLQAKVGRILTDEQIDNLDQYRSQRRVISRMLEERKADLRKDVSKHSMAYFMDSLADFGRSVRNGALWATGIVGLTLAGGLIWSYMLTAKLQSDSLALAHQVYVDHVYVQPADKSAQSDLPALIPVQITERPYVTLEANLKAGLEISAANAQNFTHQDPPKKAVGRYLDIANSYPSTREGLTAETSALNLMLDNVSSENAGYTLEDAKSTIGSYLKKYADSDRLGTSVLVSVLNHYYGMEVKQFRAQNNGAVPTDQMKQLAKQELFEFFASEAAIHDGTHAGYELCYILAQLATRNEDMWSVYSFERLSTIIVDPDLLRSEVKPEPAEIHGIKSVDVATLYHRSMGGDIGRIARGYLGLAQWELMSENTRAALQYLEAANDAPASEVIAARHTPWLIDTAIKGAEATVVAQDWTAAGRYIKFIEDNYSAASALKEKRFTDLKARYSAALAAKDAQIGKEREDAFSAWYSNVQDEINGSGTNK